MQKARALAGLTVNRNSGGGMKKQGKPTTVGVPVISLNWVRRKSSGNLKPSGTRLVFQ